MVRRHHLIEIKGIKELTLSISSTPHHSSLPPTNHSIERNHGSQIVSTRVLQQNQEQSRHDADTQSLRLVTRSGHGGIDYSISLRACVQRRRERGFAHQGREASYMAAMYSRASPVAYALRRRCISRIESSATRRSSAVRMYLRMAPSVSPASSCSTSSCTR
jgi:hypothetical protein